MRMLAQMNYAQIAVAGTPLTPFYPSMTNFCIPAEKILAEQ